MVITSTEVAPLSFPYGSERWHVARIRQLQDAAGGLDRLPTDQVCHRARRCVQQYLLTLPGPIEAAHLSTSTGRVRCMLRC